MSVSTPSKPSHTQHGTGAVGKAAGQGGDGDLGSFSLRDTLNGIVVREANFGEFLAALKSFGTQPIRR